MGTLNPFVPRALLRLCSFEICPNYIIRASCFLCSWLLLLVIISQWHCVGGLHTLVRWGQVRVMNKDGTLLSFNVGEKTLLKYRAVEPRVC